MGPDLMSPTTMNCIQVIKYGTLLGGLYFNSSNSTNTRRLIHKHTHKRGDCEYVCVFLVQEELFIFCSAINEQL